jgi:methyltransferase family protein
LDYGCGPGPTASIMMAERGFPTNNYDQFFSDDEAVLSGKYDFVICTEVLEHLRRPSDDLAKIDAALNLGGVFGVMTGVLEDDSTFADWWYIRDFTHISFYRPETLAWIARRFNWVLTRPSRDAALFRKSRSSVQ